MNEYKHIINLTKVRKTKDLDSWEDIAITLLCNDKPLKESYDLNWSRKDKNNVEYYYYKGSIAISPLFIKAKTSLSHRKQVVQELKENKDELCLLCINKAIYQVSKLEV